MPNPLLPVGDRPLLEVGSSEAARRCVLAGLGLGFLSRHAVAEDLARGTLVRVDLAGTPVRRRFHAARLRRVTPPAAALPRRVARPIRPRRHCRFSDVRMLEQCGLDFPVAYHHDVRQKPVAAPGDGLYEPRILG